MDVMTRNPVVVNPETLVYDAVSLMLKAKVGSLIVRENQILKGIVTEKDLVEKVILKGANPKKTKISELMNTIIITVDPSTNIMGAIKLFAKYNIRRLPVVTKEGTLAGLVTVNDILRVQPELFEMIFDKSRMLATRAEYIDSVCDNCKIYGVVKLVNNRFLCQDCERNETIINYKK